jgi:hypothetical protein
MTKPGLFGACIAALLMGAIMPAEAKSAQLADYRWKSRLLVVVAPSADDSELIAQRRLFQQASKGMAERDVVLLEAAGDSERARQIRRQLSAGSDQFRATLVGKDGNAAFSSAKPVTAAELFSRIDAMPMRRDEMRRGKD